MPTRPERSADPLSRPLESSISRVKLVMTVTEPGTRRSTHVRRTKTLGDQSDRSDDQHVRISDNQTNLVSDSSDPSSADCDRIAEPDGLSEPGEPEELARDQTVYVRARGRGNHAPSDSTESACELVHRIERSRIRHLVRLELCGHARDRAPEVHPAQRESILGQEGPHGVEVPLLGTARPPLPRPAVHNRHPTCSSTSGSFVASAEGTANLSTGCCEGRDDIAGEPHLGNTQGWRPWCPRQR